MKKIKKLLYNYFENFGWFYQYLRGKIFVIVAFNILLGILDGISLSMFLPLLQMVDGSTGVNSSQLGNFKFIIDKMQSLGIPVTLVSVLVFLCIFFTIKGFARFFCDTYVVNTQQYFIRKVRLKMLNSLNGIQFKSFISADVGRIQNTLSGEADKVSRAFLFYFIAFQQIVLVAVYIALAFFVDAQFAILVTLGGLITNFVYKTINNTTKSASRDLTTGNNEFQGLIIQHVGNYKYIRATGLVKFFGGRLVDKIMLVEKHNRKIGVLTAMVAGAREPLLIFVVAGVILIQVKAFNAPLGPILISLLFFYRALAALLLMQTSWNYFLSLVGSIDNMRHFQYELDQTAEKEGTKVLQGFKEKIELKDLSLKYGDKIVLKDINLVVNKNETVAFAGESGSGKTSLVNIMACLLPPDSGTMTIDKVDRKEMDTAIFQRKIGYVTQDPVIFNDSIFNNITLWAEHTPDNIARFKAAAEKAAIFNFVSTLPEKEMAMLGNNGINLSGGQKQRISIARELYKDIDLLILDEATSALDSETEVYIKENIEALKGQYTILIVAHRLSTIKNADKIVLMSEGRIEKVGTYQDLVETTPLFKRMVSLQEL